MWITVSLDREPGVRDHGDGGASVLGLFLLRPPGRWSSCPTQLAGGLHRRRLHLAARRRGGARGQQAHRGGPEQHAAGIKHITSRSFEGAARPASSSRSTLDIRRAMQDARPHGGGAGVFLATRRRPPCALQQRQQQPGGGMALSPRRRAARASSPSSPTRRRRAARSASGRASARRTGRRGARCASTSTPTACARLRDHAGAGGRTGEGAFRPAGRPVVGRTQDRHPCASKGRVADPRQFADMWWWRSVTAHRCARPTFGTVVEASAESRNPVAGERPARRQSPTSPQQDATAGPPARRSSAIEELRKSPPADVELLVYASSDFVKGCCRRAAHADRRCAAHRHRVLFLHSRRSTVITGLTLPIAVIARASSPCMPWLHAQLHDDDGAVAVHRIVDRRRHRRARTSCATGTRQGPFTTRRATAPGGDRPRR